MLREIKNQQEWNELVLKNSPKSGGFLGSWEWGEFQERVGKSVKRFADGNQRAQVIEHTLPFRKKYWYVPRGGSLDLLCAAATERGALFIRFESVTESEIPSRAQKTNSASPPATLIINLTKSADELLVAMHEKTRYNIRLAERKGVRVRTENREQRTEFDAFWNLLQETARRDGFRTHNRSYYERMLDIPWVEFWTAEWDGKVLAAGLWACFGDTVTYLHGASSSEHRNVMAPYLLHWEMMREAKNRGFKAYDFWGIQSPTTYNLIPTTSWSGMTRFKLGFGGETVEYPGTYDLPISKFWYRIYKLARKIRRL